jgi:secreted trypsin-like serine protease
VPMVSIACNGNVPTANGNVSDATYYHCSSGTEMVAAAPSLSKDTCQGDSGGPMYVVTQDGGIYLAATVSRATGTPGVRICGDGGIYVRVDGKVLQWIENQGIHVFVAQ